MEEKNLKIVEYFKEELRKRIVSIWWIICAAFLVSVGLYCWFNRADYLKNLQIFAIVLAVFISIFAALTLSFYYTRRKKFFGILALLDEEDLPLVEKLYNFACMYGHRNLGVITKEGIALIRGFFMFKMIPREDLIWIYQYNTDESYKAERVPAMGIVTNRSDMYSLLGYKVTNFMRKMYPNIYLSVEGTLRHRELQNLFAMDFVKMAEATGNFSRLPTKYDETAEGRKQVDLGTLIDKKRKKRVFYGRIRLVFIVLLQIGLFLCLIGLGLWLLSKNPTTGRQVLKVNLALGVLFVLFILTLMINFFLHLLTRKFLHNAVYFIVLVIFIYGLKSSHLYDYFKDLSDRGYKRFFSIVYVGYRNEFWIPKQSEYLFYVIPAGSRDKNDRRVFSLKKAELANTDHVDDIIKNVNVSKPLYLALDFYPNSGAVEKAAILDRTGYEEALAAQESAEKETFTAPADNTEASVPEGVEALESVESVENAENVENVENAESQDAGIAPTTGESVENPVPSGQAATDPGEQPTPPDSPETPAEAATPPKDS
ncbi:MAG: hypothetical protein LBQ97_04910 [Fusobacteriaceae bacterium]|jgi:ABC-type Fe3+-siderophore transport system permease subunit|nr:hypothetical protein [Fusobacteriaceae bacterium]